MSKTHKVHKEHEHDVDDLLEEEDDDEKLDAVLTDDDVELERLHGVRVSLCDLERREG